VAATEAKLVPAAANPGEMKARRVNRGRKRGSKSAKTSRAGFARAREPAQGVWRNFGARAIRALPIRFAAKPIAPHASLRIRRLTNFEFGDRRSNVSV